ncbi:hypothetical protein OKW26_007382 [Paraburkholderia sp. 32]
MPRARSATSGFPRCATWRARLRHALARGQDASSTAQGRGMPRMARRGGPPLVLRSMPRAPRPTPRLPLRAGHSHGCAACPPDRAATRAAPRSGWRAPPTCTARSRVRRAVIARGSRVCSSSKRPRRAAPACPILSGGAERRARYRARRDTRRGSGARWSSARGAHRRRAARESACTRRTRLHRPRRPRPQC